MPAFSFAQQGRAGVHHKEKTKSPITHERQEFAG
jgi:hypothetical protein